jgi:hypothetical protein
MYLVLKFTETVIIEAREPEEAIITFISAWPSNIFGSIRSSSMVGFGLIM